MRISDTLPAVLRSFMDVHQQNISELWRNDNDTVYTKRN